MLKTLHLTNFTVFEDTKFEISPGLNVVIGDNGVGKTHLLKVAYTMMIGASSLGKTPHDESVVGVSSFVLSETFQTSALNELCRQGAPAAKIACHLEDSEEALQLDVDISQSPIYGKDLSNYADLEIIQQPKQANFSPSPIFIPVKETLSVFPGFVSLYEEYHIEFDHTYYSLCKALARPLRKKLEDIEDMLASLEAIIGGKAVMEDGRFYFRFSGQAHLTNINTIAEGHRKVALLAYLLANNSIKPGVTLLWDEPETNLNPRLMKDLAAALAQLARHGVQVILATHSLFLMKELNMQCDTLDESVPMRFFSLAQSRENTVILEQGERLSDLETVVSLDESLAQYDREHEAYYRALEKSSS